MPAAAARCRRIHSGVPDSPLSSPEMLMTTRRDFLEKSLFAAAAAVWAGETSRVRAEDTAKASASPNEKVRMACIGVRGRGREHLDEFGRMHDVEVVAIVDVDEEVGKKGVEQIKRRTDKAPVFYRDLRKMLVDKRIDAVSIATPNHWHSLAAIWALQAGKHVYVEKPVSHNVHEGRMVVEFAQKLGKICQAGTQSRSQPGMRQAIDYVHSG